MIDVINQPRYPSLKGIMASKRKPVETSTVADLGIDPASVGLQGAQNAASSMWRSRQPRAAGEVYEDKGDAAQRIIEFLIARKVTIMLWRTIFWSSASRRTGRRTASPLSWPPAPAALAAELGGRAVGVTIGRGARGRGA